MMREAFGARGALLLVLFAAACGKGGDRDRGDFERMRVQQRGEAYSPSELFAGDERLRHPPPGTVSRESEGDTGVTGSGMVAGAPATMIPIGITPALLARGREKFHVYCAVCHGVGGFGGSIVAENMGAPRPPSLRSESMIGRAPGYFFVVATHGFGRMPPYAPQLTVADRWAVVAYLEQLQHESALTPDERDDSLGAIKIRSIDSALAAEQRR